MSNNTKSVKARIIRRNEDVANRKITLMVMILLAMYFFGYTPFTFSKMIKYWNGKPKVAYQYLRDISFILVIIVKSSDIFIYYTCNNEYKRIFDKTFRFMKIKVAAK
jgi:hypothetical protein